MITFRVRHSRGEMYIGHGRQCVCVSVGVPPCTVCLSVNTIERSVRGHKWVGSTKSAEAIEIHFRLLTYAGSSSNVLVAWTYWRHLVNTIQPSSVPAKRQQRIQSDRVYICYSAYPFIHCWRTRVSRHIFLIKFPCDVAFRQNSLTSCYYYFYYYVLDIGVTSS